MIQQPETTAETLTRLAPEFLGCPDDQMAQLFEIARYEDYTYLLDAYAKSLRENERFRIALEFYLYDKSKKQYPDFYDEMDFEETAREALK